jgi:hypothetical protein
LTRAANEYERADHERDLRSTVDTLPPGLDAHTVAMLCRARTTDFAEAVSVIEQYAKVVAGDAVMKALAEAHKLTMEILEGTDHA